MENKNKILFVGVILFMLFMGYAFHGAWDQWNENKEIENQIEENNKILNGLYIYSSENKSTAKDHAKSRDGNADWVCINVAYQMSYSQAYKTCVHECSHMAFTEIWAEECDKDPVKCLEVINGLAGGGVV